MTPDEDFAEAVEKIIEKDSRYSRAAYFFVREGLDVTIKAIKGKPPSGRRRQPKPDSDDPNHVSALELLSGLRDHALEQFGPMAALLLEQWGLRRSDNFGDIVFNLVEGGVFGKTDSDSRDDFSASKFDFADALRAPFRPSENIVRMHKKAIAEAIQGDEEEASTAEGFIRKVKEVINLLDASPDFPPPDFPFPTGKKSKSKTGKKNPTTTNPTATNATAPNAPAAPAPIAPIPTSASASASASKQKPAQAPQPAKKGSKPSKKAPKAPE
jgi:uncharacterized repeat protein (TIGR04138 family)